MRRRYAKLFLAGVLGVLATGLSRAEVTTNFYLQGGGAIGGMAMFSVLPGDAAIFPFTGSDTGLINPGFLISSGDGGHLAGQLEARHNYNTIGPLGTQGSQLSTFISMQGLTFDGGATTGITVISGGAYAFTTGPQVDSDPWSLQVASVWMMGNVGAIIPADAGGWMVHAGANGGALGGIDTLHTPAGYATMGFFFHRGTMYTIANDASGFDVTAEAVLAVQNPPQSGDGAVGTAVGHGSGTSIMGAALGPNRSINVVAISGTSAVVYGER